MPELKAFLLSLAVGGCAARAVDTTIGGGPGTRTHGDEIAREADETPDEPAEPERAEHQLPRDIVERSAMPYHGFMIQGHQPLPPNDFFDELAKAHALCIGERHDNAHDHYAELAILREISERSKVGGRELALGLEMVQQPFQWALDRYGAGVIDDQALVQSIQWRDRWGHPFAFYRPMLEVARSSGARLLALGAATELVDQVAASGIESLDNKQRRNLPELDLQDREHRAAFERAMKEHPNTGKDPQHLYEVQVLWDETMADTAARFLAVRFPLRQVVLLAGAQHCRRSAIPARIVRRTPGARVYAVRPVLDTGDDAAFEEMLRGYDYGFVMSTSP